MNIPEIGEKIKRLIGDERIFISLLLLFVSLASFGLGRFSVSHISGVSTQSASVVKVTNPPPKQNDTSDVIIEETKVITSSDTSALGVYVGSKNGTKYHLPWCSGAKTINEENKVWFQSKEEAVAAGYTAAANCKGI